MIQYSRFTGMLAVAALTCSLATPAVAAPVVFFDHDVRTLSTQPFPNTTTVRNSFLSQISTLGGTAFHQNLTSGIANGANPSFGFPGSTITATTTNVTFQFVTGFGVNDTNNGSATSALIETEVTTGTGNVAVDNSITFSQPINAFGLYVSQAGDGLGHPITFRIENTLVPGSARDIVIPVGPNWQSSAISYLGIIDTAATFDRFTMIENTDVDQNGTADDVQDGIILDNLTIATVVPEPSTLALVSLGAVLPILARRRMRAKAAG